MEKQGSFVSSRPLTPTTTPGIYRRGSRYVVVLRDRDGKHVRRRYYRGTIDTPKSAYGLRVVPLSEPMAADLAELRDLVGADLPGEGERLVFPSPTGLPIEARSVSLSA
jgi:hypothetical protein